MPLRKPTKEEVQFIAFMIREGKGNINDRWRETLMVAPMDDGNTGSLLLYPDGNITTGTTFGHTLFEVEFKDADRVAVVANRELSVHAGRAATMAIAAATVLDALHEAVGVLPAHAGHPYFSRREELRVLGIEQLVAR